MSTHLPGEPCPCFDCRADEPEQQQEQPYPDEPYPDALVTPDAVEAAARAMYLLANSASPSLTWETAEPYWIDAYRTEAETALAAAAPLIAQQTLEDAAIDLNNHAVSLPTPDAPETCPNAGDGFCHHDATVTAYITASQRLTARAATLTPKDTP